MTIETRYSTPAAIPKSKAKRDYRRQERRYSQGKAMGCNYTIRETKLYGLGKQTESVFTVFTMDLPMQEVASFETSADAEEFIRQQASAGD